MSPILSILYLFAPLFSQERTWKRSLQLMLAAIMCPAQRTVAACLRVLGLKYDIHFSSYHQILNRVKWNSITGSKILLGILIENLAPLLGSNLVFAIDETVERRKGEEIKAKGCYRDAVRSSKARVVTTYGLKWICLSLIVPIPWTKRSFALPFMTVLAPSKAHNEAKKKKHKTTIDWASQMVHILSGWLGKLSHSTTASLIGDGAYACVRFAWQCVGSNMRLITRFRMDAALYESLPLENTKKRGRPASKGKKARSLKEIAKDATSQWETKIVSWYGQASQEIEYITGVNLWYTPGEKPIALRWVITRVNQQVQALMCTDTDYSPEKIIEEFVLRWNIEVTFEESRAHMGIETQRQYSDLAIGRTTPCLMGLYSLVIVFGNILHQSQSIKPQSSAWYHKERITFLDILKVVRAGILEQTNFLKSAQNAELNKFNELKDNPLWNILSEWVA